MSYSGLLKSLLCRILFNELYIFKKKEVNTALVWEVLSGFNVALTEEHCTKETVLIHY